MKRRKWDSRTKAMIVMQGLNGRPVSEICTEHQISQAQYYQWREQFLRNVHRVFGNHDRREKVILRENTRRKNIIGDLTLESKKLDEWWE